MVSPSLNGVVGSTSWPFFSCANPWVGSERQSASARAVYRIEFPPWRRLGRFGARGNMIDPNAFTRIASPWIPLRARNPVEFGQEYVVGRVVDGLPPAGFEVYPVENLGKLRVQSLTVIADEE